MSLLVGLTGGIGSGKSTVSGLFSELGVTVIDTDIISHQLTQAGGAAIPAIRAAFGDEYINAENALDRSKMRQLVFSDANAMQRLEKILHPLILSHTQSLASSSRAPYVLIVIPLLFETQTYQSWLQRTVAVDCAEATQITRASKREGLNEQAVLAIMAKQISRLERQKFADDLILNDSSLSDLRLQISKLHLHYLELAKRSN